MPASSVPDPFPNRGKSWKTADTAIKTRVYGGPARHRAAISRTSPCFVRGLTCDIDPMKILLLTAAMLFALPQGALAATEEQKLYRWVDDEGVVHYGDSVPAEYAEVDKQVVNEHGVTLDVLRGKKTREELAAEKRERGAAGGARVAAAAGPGAACDLPVSRRNRDAPRPAHRAVPGPVERHRILPSQPAEAARIHLDAGIALCALQRRSGRREYRSRRSQPIPRRRKRSRATN